MELTSLEHQDRSLCELTILMPCLNEARTLSACINKAKSFLHRSAAQGEILIADNGSTDGSQEIAIALGARVVNVPQRGYGAALIAGIEASRGEYIIFGDADDSYDFSQLEEYLVRLRSGDALVMGNRFAGRIMPGAMPFLHRWLGNPVLSGLGRLFFKLPIGDFHCGLRGLNKIAIKSLELQAPGMEFASEMVVKAGLANLKISEVPITLYKDGRDRAPHLRTWRDGWRHLKFLLLMSPDWLFLVPATILIAIGLPMMIGLSLGPVQIGSIGFGIHTLLYAAEALLLGWQLIIFYVVSKTIATHFRILPPSPRLQRDLTKLTLERGLLIGAFFFLAGVLLSIFAVNVWVDLEYGQVDPEKVMRIVIPATTLMLAGAELSFASFLIQWLSYLNQDKTQP